MSSWLQRTPIAAGLFALAACGASTQNQQDNSQAQSERSLEPLEVTSKLVIDKIALKHEGKYYFVQFGRGQKVINVWNLSQRQIDSEMFGTPQNSSINPTAAKDLGDFIRTHKIPDYTDNDFVDFTSEVPESNESNSPAAAP